MTHDYKEIWEEFVKRNGEQGFFAESIRHALTIASEYERVKKERDDYKALYDVMVERYTELAKKVRGENGNA